MVLFAAAQSICCKMKKNWLQLFHSNYDDLCNICHPNKHICCFLYSRLLHCFIYISIDFIPQLWHPYTFILELFVINHNDNVRMRTETIQGNGVRFKKRKFVNTGIFLQNILPPRSNCKSDETSNDDILNSNSNPNTGSGTPHIPHGYILWKLVEYLIHNLYKIGPQRGS